MKVGVLALQGDFSLHAERLTELGVEAVLVKKPEELHACQGLILPGGETTTLVKLLKNSKLFEEIPEFNKKCPVFGTCAGTILLGSSVSNHSVEQFKLIDIAVERNAYGRQIDSFIDQIDVQIDGKKTSLEGVFIRAPKITVVGGEVTVLGYHQMDTVLVENRAVLAATFHPELSDGTIIHEYFLKKIRDSR